MSNLHSAGAAHARKRYLIPIGGNELKSKDSEIYKRMVQLGGGTSARIAIVPTASSIPEERAKAYTDVFERFEPESIEVLMIDERSEAAEPAALKVAEEATVVMFGGGDQLRLSSIIGGTPLHEVFLRRYREGCVIAGSSAGAAAIPNIMIFQNHRFENYRRGGLEIAQGLGFVDGAIFDTHFVQRNRISRLVQAVATNPALLGLGIEENTGLVVEDEATAECIGTGTVIVVDGRDSGYTNISEVQSGQPFAITGLKYSVLTEGMSYNLPGREVFPTADRKVHLVGKREKAATAEE